MSSQVSSGTFAPHWEAEGLEMIRGLTFTPLSESSIPRLVNAMDDPEFEPIRDDLIKMTLDHYLHNDGLAQAAKQAESMPLTPDELKRYVESRRIYNITEIEPIPTIEWAASALPSKEQAGLVPNLFLDWTKLDTIAATNWLSAQEPSKIRDETIASFATKATDIDSESAATWALEIKDSNTRAATLNGVIEKWRQEDSSAANQWVEKNKRSE
jgi:hypothetical protein